ncbi:50S ribosomal protein L25/general stress protein Ctc [Alkalilimnicola ehrlichii MLHE-1]|uniref:Large ribosomal subunit protein bL25 n=1 Tax=Alkalilimnicola ehrlichii (strain ATCC BAA-1101 / DSM 17681 / MLHE-1) TaxID=187272 RepID=RL25_ALKEH|nr:50S ribosomal protein L25/general stress protein Ctc [Alkalilimnicola ehrlichii]Q0ABZ8.1 RecName: Full=Large ribosomal subunit protein bL25; AltName: Full=50S ribosomal protein L25; AltName: Full=General stress protein CTC [Alkalilimnicola ehrlichii MLHE-1]ABI55639.1 LSU ribosomal protein L25P [Alkalilimnicola ehrlichii MLHE-1]
MSAIEMKLDAELRTETGRGASRRLRRAKRVPAIMYGGHQEPQAITLNLLQLDRLMQEEAFYSQILTVNLDGKSEQVIVKDLQRHPFKPLVEHVDLQRVVAGEKVHTSVPVHFVNEDKAPGIKAGGIIHHDLNEIEIACLPKDLPEYLEVDVSALELGSAIHLSDVPLPAGVEIPELVQGADHDHPVVSIHASRKAKADEDEAAEGEEGEEGAED